MKRLFTDGWQFGKFTLDATAEEILNAGDGQTVNQKQTFAPVDLPHDWMIYQTQDLYENSIGCYRKTFDYTDKGGHVFLNFEGVYMDSHYYVNGEEVFFWPYGYSTFEFEITPYLTEGKNELLVTCRYESPNTRWYSGAGIYRNVWLVEKSDAYLVTGGTYFSTEEADGNDFRITIDAEAVYRSQVLGDTTDAVIRHTILDADGTLIAQLTADALLSDEVTRTVQEMHVTGVHRWDITDPYLYTLTTELIVEDTPVDVLCERVGFRTLRFDPNEGFFLNDRYVKIHGACMHHDLGSLGAAVNKNALRRQFESLQRMGVNSIRTSHNMPSVELMELADEMGMLIDSESFDMWESPKTDYDYARFFNEYWQKDVTSWVRRDRNHPSVIMWSIGNEIHDTHTEVGLRITKMLRDEVRTHDYRHNAFTTIGSNYIAWEGAQRCSDELELSGYNYAERLYNEHHEKYPHWCIYGSETSSTVQSRGIYHFPASNRLLTFEDLQCSSLDNCSTNWGAKNTKAVITMDRDAEFCFGQYIWTGWDYIGEPTPYFTKNSYFGQVDTAGYEKDPYYIYQAEWTDYKKAPMVHLVPYWDFNPGQLIDVQVYSNAPKVELFFNDVSQGTYEIDHVHGTALGGTWQIPYSEGTLRAVAYDENDVIVATDAQTSFGDPAAIRLATSKGTMQANGEDLIFMDITTVDENGTFVANARNRMKVTVTGAARLVGLDNGDSTDYDQYKGTSRKLFSGRLLAILAAKKEAGDICVTVASNGLPSANITLKSYEAEPIPGANTGAGDGTSASTEDYYAHVCATTENYETPHYDEVPIRKVTLTAEGPRVLNADCRETTVRAEIHPANATYRSLTYRAITLDGVDSNAVKVTPSEDGLSATITALGDEECYYLYCFANNGKDHPEVLSILEYKNEGLGCATLDPYQLVCACKHSASNLPTKLSFQGGTFTNDEPTWLRFDNVDFGEYGSDEVSIPIFSFSTCLPIEIWEGTPEDGTLLFHGNYESPSWYNHYQANTFRLSKRLKGVKTISIKLFIKLSINGFVFTRFEKAFGTLNATENNMINGDSYIIEEDLIREIGNNVDIEFRNMNFGEKGCSKITICGRSHIPTNTIHVRFSGDGGDVNQIVEFPESDDLQEITFPLTPVYGMQKVNFIFLPGCKFDFKEFRFE